MNYCFDFVKPSGKEEIERLATTDYYRSGKLEYKIYKNAYIVPADMSSEHFHRGVLTCDGKIVQNSLLFEGFEPDWADKIDISTAKIVDDIVIYLGWLEPVWGHILTDCLKKLWFVFTDECRKLQQEGAKLVAIIPWNYRAQRELFELIGISLDSIENVSQLSQFKEVIIPDNSIVAMPDDTRYFYREYKDVVSRILEKIPQQKSTGKLYFSRTSFSDSKFWKRREYGEEAIEKTFVNLGYTIVRPEKLNVLDTLVLLRNCDSFASTEGSISHNALFCRPGANVVIVRKVEYVNSWQLVINQVSDIDVTYIDAHQSVISNGCLGPFYMCVTKELEQFFGQRILHVPHLLRPSFLWYLVQNRKITKRLLRLFGIK